MNYNVLDRIRKTNLKKALVSLIYVLMFNIPLIAVLYGIVTEGLEGSMIFILVLFGFFAILVDISFVKMIILIISPEKSDLFKKYGSVEKIQKILNEIEKTKEYEDKNLVVSKNYLCDKKDLEKIVKCSDVLGVHKLVHKTNFVIDYYKIIITDKYGEETSYTYNANQEELCNKLLGLISSKCHNAEIGYHKDEWDHINKNKIDLPSNNNESNDDYEYKCPECSSIIEYGDKFCKNCACKLDWEDEEESIEEEFKATFKSTEEKISERKIMVAKHQKNKLIWKLIGIGILSIISSEMILLMILGDSVEGTPALILTFVCAIPLFALYYYLFIGKKNK